MSTVQVLKSPNRTTHLMDHSVFLAGSIEMGKVEDWQKKVTEAFEGYEVQVFNPRRDDWDSSWVQDIKNPKFYEQVTWELDHLDIADHIIMYFDPATMSPISLLELGIYAPTDKLIVCCPDGFWRKGNVEIVCEKYSIPLFNNMNSLITYYINKIVKYT